MNRVVNNKLKKIFWKLPIGSKAKEHFRRIYASQKEKKENALNVELEISEKADKEDYIKEIISIPTSRSNEYTDFENHSKESFNVDLVAYYLTQFHPNEKNDLWWGKGTTEWTNVSKAVPQFVSHYQPRLPGELGYYDLRLETNIARQIELAKNYGINVFCFYYYWFSGERLLEKPLNLFLQNKSLDMKFCLCWANENWTKRFSGTSTDVLMKVGETKEDNIGFIYDVIGAFQDSRYYQINGKPVLVIYRPSMIKNIKEVLNEWRRIVKEKIEKDIYLIAVQEKEDNTNWIKLGFDSETEFQPKRVNSLAKDITTSIQPIRKDFSGEVKDYKDLVENKKYIINKNLNHKVYPAVMPMWDNTARRNDKALIYHGSSPELYKKWLEHVIENNKNNKELDKNIVFINAWNEWGEGAYLEPDRYWGYAYLQATYEALFETESRGD